MLKSKLHLVLLFSALLAAGLFSDAWLAARHDVTKLASTLATQNAALQRASEEEKERDAQLATALAKIEAQKSAVKIARQAAAAIPSVLPALPLPVNIQFSDLAPAPSPNAMATGNPNGGTINATTGDSTSPHEPTRESTPNLKGMGSAEATLQIPQLDLKPLYNGLQDCRESLIQSASLKQDLAAEKIRSAALVKQRDAAIAAAHGGTFWTRVRREAKWFAFGLAIGAAVASSASIGPTSR